MWKFKELNKPQLNLIDKRIIDIGGEIDSDMALYVREALLRLRGEGSPDVTIMITSAGGNVGIGLDIYDFLRLYPGKKTGVVNAYARSMAAVVLQACDNRQCSVHAHILIHNSHDDVNLDTLRDWRKLKKRKGEMEKKQSRIYAILAKRTGRSITEIRKVCQRDHEMTAEEAKAFGLIDQIV